MLVLNALTVLGSHPTHGSGYVIAKGEPPPVVASSTLGGAVPGEVHGPEHLTADGVGLLAAMFPGEGGKRITEWARREATRTFVCTGCGVSTEVPGEELAQKWAELPPGQHRIFI
jgi:hypothetical protein